jgi:hypothetical protein
MTPGAGVPAYLMARIGGAWVALPEWYTQRGEGGVILDGGSNFSISFPRPYGHANFSCSIQIQGDYQGQVNTVRVVDRYAPGTGVGCVGLSIAGVGVPGASLGYTWIATGVMTPAARDEAPVQVPEIEYDDDGHVIYREQTPDELAQLEAMRARGSRW